LWTVSKFCLTGKTHDSYLVHDMRNELLQIVTSACVCGESVSLESGKKTHSNNNNNNK
jgi:hypothetical protein